MKIYIAFSGKIKLEVKKKNNYIISVCSLLNARAQDVIKTV